MRSLYPCPCCGHHALSEKSPGTYEICPICFWEDDLVQFEDPTYAGGANVESLEEARENFARIGVSASRYLNVVLKPLPSESEPARMLGQKRSPTRLELAVRRNRGIRLRPKLLEALSGFEKFAESKVTIHFSTLIEADEDNAFIIQSFTGHAKTETFLKRWQSLEDARLFFVRMATFYNDETCHVRIKDCEYLGSIILRRDIAIHHAIDLAIIDRDTVFFVMDHRSSCFYVDVVGDYYFKGIEAQFFGPCIDVARSIPDGPDPV